MQLKTFDGGLSTRLAPHLINKNQAVIYTNIDNDKGILSPIKDKLLETDVSGCYTYYFVAENEWNTSEVPQDWVEWQDTLYWSPREGTLQRRKDSTTTEVVITPPSYITIKDTLSDGVETHEYTYAASFYNINTGAESTIVTIETERQDPGELSLTIEVSPPTDSQVTHIRLYRLGNNLTAYTLIHEYEYTVLNIYIDEYSDTEVDGRLLNSDLVTAFNPINIKYLTEYNSVFIGAINDKIYFTPTGKPDIWPVFNSLTLPKTITGIGKTSFGLLIFTTTSTHLVRFNPISLVLLSLDDGCKSQDSIQSFNTTCLWVSYDGICISNGSDVQVLTKHDLGRVDLEFTSSAVHDNEYYLQLTDRSTLILDFDRQITKKESHGVDVITVAEDSIYGCTPNKLYKLYNAEKTYLSLHYKSGQISLGALTVYALYKTIYITFEGYFTFKVYINKELAACSTLQSSKIKIEEIKINNEYSKGLFIEFEVSGKGSLYEINFEDNIANA